MTEVNHCPDQQYELVPLNLMWNSSVKRSKYEVLRELIRIFYIHLGHQRWYETFSNEINNMILTFRIQNIGFNCDSLLHSKNFKIAALCAIRDYNWSIAIASRDWELELIEAPQADQHSPPHLAYRIVKNVPARDDTVLHMYPFKTKEAIILQNVLYEGQF